MTTVSGITWSAETLDVYLTNPKKYIPGKMIVYFSLTCPGLGIGHFLCDVIIYWKSSRIYIVQQVMSFIQTCLNRELDTQS